VIATKEHSSTFANRLAAAGQDLDTLRAQGRLVELNAAETLAKFLGDGWPDAARFQEVMGPVFTQALARASTPRVAAYGEMVALLCADGKHAAAVEVERLWNDLSEHHAFELLCSYPISVFSEAGQAESLAAVCAAHERTMPTESHTSLGSDKARNDHVIELQRKSLEADRERTRRVEAEEALRRRERELGELLETIGEGVIDLDPDGKLRYANRAYLAFLSAGSVDQLGRDVRSIVAPRPLFDEVWARLVRGEVVRSQPAQLATHDGRTRRIVVDTAVLRMVGRTLYMRWFLQLLPD
jgi:PAS domain-containing protein